MKTAVEILTEARDLIAQPGKWSQGWLAKNSSGHDCASDDPDAGSFCLLGAIERVIGTTTDREWSEGESVLFHNAVRLVESVTGEEYVSVWNDDPTRTQEEVVQAFSKAIEIAKEKSCAT